MPKALKMENGSSTIHIRLTGEMREKIVDEAVSEHRSVNNQVLYILENHFREKEGE